MAASRKSSMPGTSRPAWPSAPRPLVAEVFPVAPPFAALDRISAQMDREMAALMDAAALPPPALGAERMLNVDIRALPPGAAEYSYVSTIGGDGSYCSRSVEITRAWPYGRPHVVTHQSGDCRAIGSAGYSRLAFRPAASRRADHRRPHLAAARPSEPEMLNVAYRPAW